MRSRETFIIVLLYFMQLNFSTYSNWSLNGKQMNLKETDFSWYDFLLLIINSFLFAYKISKNLLHKVHRISTSWFVVESLKSGVFVSDYCFNERETYFRIMCFDTEAIRLKRDWV